MSIRTYFENIADAIREKIKSADAYTPEEMPEAIRSIKTGGDLYTNYSYTPPDINEYICETSRTLLCTLSGRTFYKTTDDFAYVCYAKQSYSNYSGPLLISKIADGVKYTVENSPTFSAIGSFEHNGETWYVSTDEYFMRGDLTSSAGFCKKFVGSGSNRLQMGESFLNFILSIPSSSDPIPCYKPTGSGLILPPDGYDGFPAIYIE